MIRTTALLLFIAFFSIYAWKNWFVSLCTSVLLLAVVEHPDFPLNIGGIQGANPWNFLILNVVLAWLAQRGDEGHEWDLAPAAGFLLLSCLAVVVFGVLRLVISDYPTGYSTAYIVSEFLVNSVKWVIPSLLLFDACRSRRRAAVALGVIICLYLLLAVQVVRWVPISSIGSGEDLAARASRIIQKEVGYNRVTLSMMLAGASWAALASVPVLRQNLHRLMLVGIAAMIAFGQALTGGRTGYVTWIAVGMTLGALRWRKFLLALPAALLVVATGMPSVRERMLQGFSGTEGNFTVGTSSYEMTSGRDIAWPEVIDEIRKSPWLGYGREAMVTTGLSDQLMNDYGESFPHPHQAYLQLLLDNGIIGSICVIALFAYALRHSFTQMMVRNDPLICAVGCTSFCLILSLMIGAFGGQTFYPREGAVGMWAAIGLMLRVHVNSLNALETGEPVFRDELPGKWFVATEDREEDHEWPPTTAGSEQCNS